MNLNFITKLNAKSVYLNSLSCCVSALGKMLITTIIIWVNLKFLGYNTKLGLFAVQKPREQVADAEALLDITSTLVTSVKSQSNEGVTPTDFVSCLLTMFGEANSSRSSSQGNNNAQMSINWKDVGLAVSPFLSTCHGCSTM